MHVFTNKECLALCDVFQAEYEVTVENNQKKLSVIKESLAR